MESERSESTLQSINNLFSYEVKARDGDAGKVHDFYFDHDSWKVRYLVVNTGSWLSGRRVMIPWAAIQSLDTSHNTLNLELSTQQIEHGPEIERDLPVSRQYEKTCLEHYGFPTYWSGSYQPNLDSHQAATSPSGFPRAEEQHMVRPVGGEEESYECKLGSARATLGFIVMSSDNVVGEISDLIVDEHGWEIRWLAVDTSPLWFGGHVLIPIDSLVGVDWILRTVLTGLAREQIKNSPEWDKKSPISIDYQQRVQEYYTRPAKAA